MHHISSRRLAALAAAALVFPAAALGQSNATHGPDARIASAHRARAHVTCTTKKRHRSCSQHRRVSSIAASVSRTDARHDSYGKSEPARPAPASPTSPTEAAAPTAEAPASSTPTPEKPATATLTVETPSTSAPPAEAPSTPTSTSPPTTSETPSSPGPVAAPTLQITGTTFYVSPKGSDSNSGTSPASAWRTVKRVNEAALAPGDGVLFEGGASFSDETLMPGTSGTSDTPIVFGSYGTGNASLPKGVWFRGHNDLAFEHLTIEDEGIESPSDFQGTGANIIIEWCSIGNDSLPINAPAPSSSTEVPNSNWTIDDNTINHAGNSGMLLEGEDFTISGNTITNTGLNSSIPYGKHGIYLKVSNATVTDNTITNFTADGISVRYRNSTLTGNHISEGPVGIAWFEMETATGTSHWDNNTITKTTEVGIYVAPPGPGEETPDHFVIEHDTIQPSAGTFMALSSAAGTFTLQENVLL